MKVTALAAVKHVLAPIRTKKKPSSQIARVLSSELSANPLLEAYVYTPLKENEIRLLEILPGELGDRIECRLRIESLDNVPRFGAVSYVWGEDATDKDIWVDGWRLSVKPNLEAALLEFRREPPKIIPISRVEIRSAIYRSAKALKDEMMNQESYSPQSIEDFRRIKQLIRDYNTAVEIDLDGASREILHNNLVTEIEAIANQVSDRESLPRIADQPQRQLLWIDAICIDQHNYIERAAQVQLMALIYSRASSLVIWFGPATKDSETLFKGLVAWADARRSKPDIVEALEYIGGVQNAVVESVLEFLENPWFKRAWVRQEYILGAQKRQPEPELVQPILTCCGTSRLRDLLPYLCLLFAELEDPVEEKSDISTINALTCIVSLIDNRALYQFSAMDDSSRLNISEGEILLKLVAESSAGKSTDPRDRVYSILGLADAYFGRLGRQRSYHYLTVDYKATVEDVYSSFVKEVVTSTNRLDIFAFWTPRTEKVNLTWTPDWSCDPSYRKSLLADQISHWNQWDKKRVLDASSGASAVAVFADNSSSLRVSGFIWDVVFSKPLEMVGDEETSRSLHRHFLLATCNSERPSETRLDRSLLACLLCRSNLSEENLRSYQRWIGIDQIELPSLYDAGNTTSAGLATEEALETKEDSIVFSSENLHPSYGDTIVLLSEPNSNAIARPFYNYAQPGDLVCILLGCATPMLLRPVEDHFELLGEVYVPGIMEGQAMAALHAGKKKLQEFVLH